MAIDSYSDLKTAIIARLDRDDGDTAVSESIALAEADFRRVLVMPDMETQVTLVATGSTALPVDCDSLRSLNILGVPGGPMEPMSLTDFYSLPVADGSCPPSRFAVSGSTLLSWPSPDPDDTYSLLLTYRAKLPSLSDTVTSNWLLAEHPDAYLFGALLHGEFYDWNDARLPIIQTKLSDILDSINMAGNRARYGAGPLIMHPAVQEATRGAYRW